VPEEEELLSQLLELEEEELEEELAKCIASRASAADLGWLGSFDATRVPAVELLAMGPPRSLDWGNFVGTL
jgi:hypothetical protein